MRNVVSYLLYSLDGVTEEPDKFTSDFDEQMYANLEAIISRQDTILLGRSTYDYWVDYWPTSDHEPFASFINETPKYIASRTMTSSAWANSTVVADIAGTVRELRSAPGGDIGIHGSTRLVRFLLGEGLVDELRLVVPPAVAGAGDRLFTGGAAYRLRLESAQPTSSGALLLAYRTAAG